MSYKTLYTVPQIAEIKKMVLDIAAALIDLQKGAGKFRTERFKKKYEIKRNQRVMMEDLIQIYVDHPDFQREFI